MLASDGTQTAPQSLCFGFPTIHVFSICQYDLATYGYFCVATEEFKILFKKVQTMQSFFSSKLEENQKQISVCI